MNHFELIKLSQNYKWQYLKFAEENAEDLKDTGFYFRFPISTEETFEEDVKMLDDRVEGINIPDWEVPNSTLFLYDKYRDKIIGGVNIGHELQKNYLINGGQNSIYQILINKMEEKNMENNVKLEIASIEDAKEIRDLMVVVADDENQRWFKDGEEIFIPGYDSINMQMYYMWDKRYYKILYNDSLAGVLLITYTGREHARIDRLYINPSFQNKGIGSRVMEQIDELYPDVRVWTLDTIQKSKRNHHFYEKCGFEKIEEDSDERYYRKIVDKKISKEYKTINDQNFDNHNFRNCKMNNVDIYKMEFANSSFTNISFRKSKFMNSDLGECRFTNIGLRNSVIGDSNLNSLEICNVSLGGAYLHDINLGFSKEKTPLLIERFEMMDSKIKESNLKNLSIENCNIEGMKIDGVLVSDMIEAYKKQNNLCNFSVE